MNLRLRLTIRFLFKHPWHSVLSITGIALGIAVVLAIDVTNESARKAFRISNAAIAAGSTHYIYGGPQSIDEKLYVDLRVTQKMRNISPVVSGYVSLRQQRFLLLGVDPFADGGSNTLPQQSEGSLNVVQLLQEKNAVFILDTTARRLRISTPTEITVEISGSSYPLYVVGTFEASNELQQHGLRNVLISDISTAQSILGMVGKLSRIDINTDDPIGISKLLPKPLTIIPNEVRSQTMDQMTRAFHLNLTALSLLALVIGAFLIYNTMTLSVLKRREQLAVLRTLGMTRRQLFIDILSEVLVLAGVGFVLGSFIGIWLSQYLLNLVTGTMTDLYFYIDVVVVSVPIQSVLKAAGLALIATVLAAWHPAWEAMRTPPMVNLMRSHLEIEARKRSVNLMIFGLFLWVAAGVVLMLSERAVVAGFAALFFIIMGFVLITPELMLRLLQLLNPGLHRYLGLLGQMAGRGVLASLSRTQIAVAALAVAVSAIVGVSLMISSFRSSVEHWLDNFLRADIYIAQQYMHKETGIDTRLINQIAGMSEIETVSTGRWVTLENEIGFTQIFAVDVDPTGFRNFQLVNGASDALWSEFVDENAVLISEPYAYHHDLKIGDSVQLPTDTGNVDFKIAAVFYDYGSDQGVVTMHRNTYDRYWDDDVVSSFSLYLKDGVDVESFVDSLNNNQLLKQSLRIRSNRTLREKSLAIFDRTFVITDVLRLLAICIAMVGILSALMAIQLERAREFAVLRATGLTPKQLFSLITTESGLMGLIAGLIACPLGMVMAWVLIFIINRRSFGWSMQFNFDIEPLLTAIGLSIAAGLIAGVYPALRMAKSLPAQALRYE